MSDLTKKEITKIASLSNNRGFAIYDENFEKGSNSGLTLSAGWTVGSDGIAISASGGWGNSALYGKSVYLNKHRIRAVVEMTTATSVFSVMKKPVTAGQFGTVLEINGTTNAMNLYASWDGSGTAPSVIKTISIGFTIIAGQKYSLELINDRTKFICVFTDLTNPANVISFNYDNQSPVNTLSGAGRMWERPGVMFISGSIKLKRFTLSTAYPKRPIVMTYGHSFVEGYALDDQGRTAGVDGVSNTYSNLLNDSLGGNVAVSGRGGDTVASLLARDDLSFFSPRYVMLDIGANDSVYGTWLTGIGSLISAVQSVGAIPILCTIVPRSGIQTFINSANAYIRSSGYNYVDFAKAVTVGNDSVTQDSSLFWTDSVHPNIAGNIKMFAQIQADAPYLWQGVPESFPATVTDYPITEIIKTASFSISASDKYATYVINSLSAVTVTYPSGIAAGLWWEIVSVNSGSVTFAAGGGATLSSADSRLKLRAPYSLSRVISRASSVGILGGDIVL